jgi:hypothetical protein
MSKNRHMSKKNSTKYTGPNNTPCDNLKKLVVGVPNTGHIDYRTVACLQHFTMPKGYQLSFSYMANSLVYTARETMAEFAIKCEATHLLFIDSDMTPPPDTIVKMLEAKKDIISGMIFKRAYPYQPCFYTECAVTQAKPEAGRPVKFIPHLMGPMEPETWPKDGVYEMQGVGTACTMIDVNVFKGLEKPWFFPLPDVGEDLSFCIKARKAGFKIWTHFGIDCGHISSFEVTKAVFEEGYRQWIKDPKNKGKLMFGEREKI